MDLTPLAFGAALIFAAAAVIILVTRFRETGARLQAEARLGEAERSKVALTAERDEANAQRLAAERELAAAEQRLVDADRRLGDFARLREESLQAAQAAMLATAQQLSSKLIDDHKRENAEAREQGEARV